MQEYEQIASEVTIFFQSITGPNNSENTSFLKEGMTFPKGFTESHITIFVNAYVMMMKASCAFQKRPVKKEDKYHHYFCPICVGYGGEGGAFLDFSKTSDYIWTLLRFSLTHNHPSSTAISRISRKRDTPEIPRVNHRNTARIARLKMHNNDVVSRLCYHDYWKVDTMTEQKVFYVDLLTCKLIDRAGEFNFASKGEAIGLSLTRNCTKEEQQRIRQCFDSNDMILAICDEIIMTPSKARSIIKRVLQTAQTDDVKVNFRVLRPRQPETEDTEERKEDASEEDEIHNKEQEVVMSTSTTSQATVALTQDGSSKSGSPDITSESSALL